MKRTIKRICGHVLMAVAALAFAALVTAITLLEGHQDDEEENVG